MDYQATIRDFIAEKSKGKELTNETDLFGGGFVTSLFALEIVLFLEETFHIRIKSKEVNAENFKTVNDIAALVKRIQG